MSTRMGTSMTAPSPSPIEVPLACNHAHHIPGFGPKSHWVGPSAVGLGQHTTADRNTGSSSDREPGCIT